MRLLACLASPIVLCAVLAQLAVAQASYGESLRSVGDGPKAVRRPPSLAASGWILYNRSSLHNGDSPHWTEFPAWDQTGSALGHGAFTTWAGSSTPISASIMLPTIPYHSSADPLTRSDAAPTNAFGMSHASAEVRSSPLCSTSTGSNATNVGSFTQLLAAIPGRCDHPWTQRTMALPGNGRVAVRLVFTPTPNPFDFSGSFLIDWLQIGGPLSLPYPPPAAGRTVHWTTAMSPVRINNTVTGQPL